MFTTKPNYTTTTRHMTGSHLIQTCASHTISKQPNIRANTRVSYCSSHPRTRWKDLNTQRKLIDEIATRIGCDKDKSRWYSVQLRYLLKQGSGIRTILAHYYGNSVANMLLNIYPEHKWELWRFNKVPQKWWKSLENQREYLDHVSRELGFKDLNSWYGVSHSKLTAAGSGMRTLLRMYNNSIFDMLTTIYPNHNWLPWQFKKVPQGYWKNGENLKRYLNYIAPTVGVSQLEDWFSVDIRSLKRAKVNLSFLRHYNGLQAALRAAYPDHDWPTWRFSSVEPSYWESPKNLRTFFDKMAESLQLSSLDDWYFVTRKDLGTLGGAGLASRWGSVPAALIASYPEHQWKLWRFRNMPSTFWTVVATESASDRTKWREMLADMICAAKQQLDILREKGISPQTMSSEDMYSLHALKSAIAAFGNLSSILQVAFPEEKLDIEFRQLENFYQSQQELLMQHATSLLKT